MNKRTLLRDELRKYVVDACGGCALQEAKDGSCWPCGTCVMSLLTRLGLDDTQPEYQAHNDEPERTRHNEVWRAILQIRDANLTGAK